MLPTPGRSASGASEGGDALWLARRTLEELLPSPPARDAAEPFRGTRLHPGLEERRGAFVTLLRHPSGELRGCIGFPEPLFPLRAAIPRAAYAAATEDPRFAPLRPTELGRVVVEVSLLTRPEPLDPLSRSEWPREIRVGRDGLIVRGHGTSGLLLPQVAPEQGWDALELLEGTCEKAGLSPGAWRDGAVTVHRFGAEIYREESPRGDALSKTG